MLIDTHSHLYADQFNEDRLAEVARCNEENVKKILLPNIDSSSIDAMHSLVDSNSELFYPMMGLHPCSVKEESINEELEIVQKHLYNKTRDYIAVGEIGIDLYWDKSTLHLQQDAFAKQIEWAKDLNLPIVIHARDSFDEIFEVVDQFNDENLKGIFHCFTGTKEQAERIINYGGFLLGIGGVVTFKNGGVDKVLKDIDIDHLVLETDAPYLAPTPNRGKRNQSSYLPLIGEKIADVYGVSLPEVAEVTTRNAVRMFNL